MTEEQFQYISKGIRYSGSKEHAYQLYQKLAQFDCTNEEKVEFALRHWGWNGEERTGVGDLIEKMKSKLFVFPHNGEAFIKQLYNIIIPIHAGNAGAHIDFDPYFSNEECFVSEIMSIQFKIRMVDIGFVQYFFRDFNFHSENMDFRKTREASNFWEITLFLAADSKIYYHEREDGIAGILSKSPMDFFTEVFGFPAAEKAGLKPITAEESLVHTSLLDKIEEQVEAGTYHPVKFN